MPTLKANKRVNAVDLYDEIVSAVPSLAPTPTEPDGKLLSRFVIEQTDDQHVLVHILNDDVDETDRLTALATLNSHKRKPEKTVDPVADAMKVVKQKADKGDDLAKAVLTILGQ